MATSRVSYDPTTNNTSYCTDTVWKSQVFTTPATGFVITRVDVKWMDAGDTGNAIINLKAVDGSDHPTGSALSTGSVAISTFPNDGAGDGAALTTFTMSEYTLAASTKYCLECYAESSGGQIGIRALTTGEYAGGSFWTSSDSGSSWSDISWDMTFDIWGNDASIAYTMEATVGEFTLTGINVNLLRPIINMAVAVGEFTLTGIDIAISRTYSMAVSVGQFVLTGINAIFTKKGWNNQDKNDASAVNPTKNASTAGNPTKNDSTFINQSKS